jgi:ABC-type glutathione transport system ATPase component
MTLRALLGILPRGARLTSGSVWFEGRCVVRDGVDNGLAALRGGGIGLVFQDATSALNPVMRIAIRSAKGCADMPTSVGAPRIWRRWTRCGA